MSWIRIAPLTFALLACAGPTPEPPAAEPTAADPEVRDEGEKLVLNGFARCGVRPPEGDPVAIEIVYHVEGPTGVHDPDVVRERAAAAVTERAPHLLGDVPGMDPEAIRAGFACESIAAPDGDVDWEIELTFGDDGEPRLAFVDVARRSALSPVSDQRGEARCTHDAMGVTWCADSAEGVAVATTLGAIACARGRCIHHRGQWWCSRKSGGWAEVGPRGPECEHGCYPPTSRQCRRI